MKVHVCEASSNVGANPSPKSGSTVTPAMARVVAVDDSSVPVHSPSGLSACSTPWMDGKRSSWDECTKLSCSTMFAHEGFVAQYGGGVHRDRTVLLALGGLYANIGKRIGRLGHVVVRRESGHKGRVGLEHARNAASSTSAAIDAI